MTFDATTEIDLSPYEPAYQAARAQKQQEQTKNTSPANNAYAVPDGVYRVNVEDVSLGLSPASGNPTVKWMLRVLGPTQQRRVIYKWNGISERSLPFLIEELRCCGVSLNRFSDLEKHLPGLIGLELEIARKTKDGRTNIYFNKLLSGKAEAEVTDDDLPF
jgi:hypothetical protein